MPWEHLDSLALASGKIPPKVGDLNMYTFTCIKLVAQFKKKKIIFYEKVSKQCRIKSFHIRFIEKNFEN